MKLSHDAVLQVPSQASSHHYSEACLGEAPVPVLPAAAAAAAAVFQLQCPCTTVAVLQYPARGSDKVSHSMAIHDFLLFNHCY
jgi:hypothetical protein